MITQSVLANAPTRPRRGADRAESPPSYLALEGPIRFHVPIDVSVDWADARKPTGKVEGIRVAATPKVSP